MGASEKLRTLAVDDDPEFQNAGKTDCPGVRLRRRYCPRLRISPSSFPVVSIRHGHPGLPVSDGDWLELLQEIIVNNHDSGCCALKLISRPSMPAPETPV
jgi:hypothetical protein